MKGFDVLHVKSAVKARNKFDLSRTHLTTMDFGQIIPLLAEETVPGDEFKVNGDFFSRLAPLVKPTYGKFAFKTVSAFVPYYMIAEDCDAWFAGKTSWEGSTPMQRWFTFNALHNFIQSYCTVGGTATDFQYTFVDSSGTQMYRKFSDKGRYWVNILNSLGYALPQGVDLQTTSAWYGTVKDTKLSAYPLLAFFKLYNDYMSQSQRFNTSPLSYALQSVKYNKAFTGYNNGTGEFQHFGLNTFFSNLFLNYDNDYFTSAWQSPNNSLGVGESINSAGVPYSVPNGAIVGQSNNDNYLYQSNGAAGGGTMLSLGQRSLDFLRSFDDWVRRNNYSGSRSVQQIYSRFGVKTDDYRSHYAQVISTETMPVQVGDVTAMADSSGVPLGDYAGKGIMSGSKGFDIRVSDYGLILVLGYFTVVPMNAYGFDRKVLRSEPLDYYNPEFDGIGADAISLGEFYADPRAIGDTTQDNQVFGFTERYNAYRFGRDQITGEFRDYNPAGNMNCWHTGRNMSAIRKAGNLVAQSSSVNTLPQDNSEYNRIFSVTNGSVDHFYLTVNFNVDAIRPMLNFNQVPRLGEGETSVPRNGNVIN